MIIPDTRTAPWQGNVGVPGGIPTRTTIYKNIVTDLGADPTGVVDASSIIQSAIENCPANQVVYMPAGTFKIAAGIGVVGQSNFSLRGAGQGQTILHVTTNDSPFYTAGTGPYPPSSTWVAISAGATRGSNTITIADTSNFNVDDLFSIGPNVLPTWAHNLGGAPDTDRTMGGMYKVRSKTPTTITFDPPLAFDFSGLSPRTVAEMNVPIMGVGYESFTINLADSSAGWALQISSAWGCWVKDVEVTGAYGRVMYFSEFVRGELRHCHTHDVRSTGSNHEALDFGNKCSWNLVEDNICRTPGPPITFGDAGRQCTGNVVAYNYIDNPELYISWDITFNHGPHNMLNLAEGNVYRNHKDDGYFGSCSHNTLFRNRISEHLELKHFSNYYNIVGNVLGTNGFNDAYEAVGSGYDTEPIYSLGYPNIGNADYAGTFGPTTPPDYHSLPNTLDGCQELDLNVADTIIRHGNFDYYNDAIVWDAGIADHAIPDSMFTTKAESVARGVVWGNLAFPPINSASPVANSAELIPAGYRYVNGEDPPAEDGTPVQFSRFILP